MKKLSTYPCDDGFYMPAEWQQQKQIWILWPTRTDNWRLGAKPAQMAFTAVIARIAKYEPVTVGVEHNQFMHVCQIFRQLDNVRIIELSSNDAWARDCGPTFLTNQHGEVRGVSWEFNAWGGLKSGLYFPWDKDNLVANKILELEQCKCYAADNFVLEGGSIHAMVQDLYNLPAEVAAGIPQVATSLENALESLSNNHDILTAGGVFSDDYIQSYIDLKTAEAERVSRTTHPIEFELYYSL